MKINKQTISKRILAHTLALSMAMGSLALAGDIESKCTEVDAGKVHYLQAGPTTGIPILLLHGGRFHAGTWRETGTLQALSDEGYYVIAIDLPGFGQTPAIITKPGEWLGKLIDVLQLDRPILVSPSLSGRFSLPLVVAHSDRLRGFVAVAPVGIQQHENAMASIMVPLLAIWGANDTLIPISHADLLLKSVSHGRKVVVPNAGHALYMDDAATFHKELIRFFKPME